MSVAFETVVGLETHVQLKTKSKLFTGCPYVFGEDPNTATCPVTLGLPGTLPVVNREAFGLAIRVGLAVGARIASHSHFDRKNYFYPDLPKGYQISQYEDPICADGSLLLESGRSIRIVRAHLEEDAGKTIHEGASSLVDLNRCGVPLLEIVTAPDLRSGPEAQDYLGRLKQLLRWLDVGDCDMEKGSLRCDVNISIRPVGEARLGTRTEIKNLNSFKAVERAIDYEAERHRSILLAGEKLAQETRLWDDDRGVTRAMRSKEDTEDYRYFADPDLPPAEISPAWVAEIRETLPELPWVRARRYEESWELSAYDADVLTRDRKVSEYFEEVVAGCDDPKASANWITGDLFALMNERMESLEDLKVRPSFLAEVVRIVRDGLVNVAGGRRVLAAGAEGGTRSPTELVEHLGLSQMSDRASLAQLVRQALEAEPQASKDLRDGKMKAAGAILGFVMKKTQGRANPSLVREILEGLLGDPDSA